MVCAKRCLTYQRHDLDRRGKATMNWDAYHRESIEGWEGCEDYVVPMKEIDEPMEYHNDYLILYCGTGIT